MPDRTLFFLWMSGCDACAEAKPHVKKFEETHDIEVRMVDLTTLDASIDEEGIPLGDAESVIRMLPPESIPAYVVLYHDGTPPRTCASRGVLTAEQLAAWVFAL